MSFGVLRSYILNQLQSNVSNDKKVQRLFVKIHVIINRTLYSIVICIKKIKGVTRLFWNLICKLKKS